MLACVAAATAFGGGLHDVDVILEVEDGVILTAEVVGPDETAQERVFAADVTLFFGIPFTDDPGFNSRIGTFPAGSVLRLNMLDSLRVWDGEDFGQTAPFLLELARGASSFFSDPSPGVTVSGPAMTVNSSGEVHVHVEHFLDAQADDGVYLMTFEIESNVQSIDATEPFFFLYDWNAAPEELLAARQWAQDNLVSAPCPADLNGDGAVGAADLAVVLGAWGPGDGPADLNGDAVVNAMDLGAMLGAWGPCP